MSVWLLVVCWLPCGEPTRPARHPLCKRIFCKGKTGLKYQACVPSLSAKPTRARTGRRLPTPTDVGAPWSTRPAASVLAGDHPGRRRFSPVGVDVARKVARNLYANHSKTSGVSALPRRRRAADPVRSSSPVRFRPVRATHGHPRPRPRARRGIFISPRSEKSAFSENFFLQLVRLSFARARASSSQDEPAA